MRWDLYIGSRFTGVSVRPDAKWPTMWRIHLGDRVSDIVNLARAKDAAITWARPKGLGGSETIAWRIRETAPAASPMRYSELAATSVRAEQRRASGEAR